MFFPLLIKQLTAVCQNKRVDSAFGNHSHRNLFFAFHLGGDILQEGILIGRPKRGGSRPRLSTAPALSPPPAPGYDGGHGSDQHVSHDSRGYGPMEGGCKGKKEKEPAVRTVRLLMLPAEKGYQ